MRRLDEPFYKSDLGFESIILDDILPLGSTAENETVAFDLYLVQSWKLLYCFFYPNWSYENLVYIFTSLC